MKKILLLAQLIALSALLSAPALRGQVASLVKDINVADVPRSQPGPVWGLHSLGESALFQMREDTVWVSDGSEGGTRMLTELCPGECSSSMQVIGTARNLLFWVTSSNSVVRRLWRSDGTRPGTFPLTDPDEGLEILYPPPVIAGNLVYFVGCTDDLGCELWRTDGTLAGTRLVADLVRGRDSLGSVETLAAGDWVLVTAEPGVWAVTSAGVLKLLSGSTSLSFSPWAASEGRIFFVQQERRELWVTDGTRAGTRFVRRFKGLRRYLTNARDGIYLIADEGQGEEIWKSNGTKEGTRRITGFANPHPFPDPSGQLRGWAGELDRRLLFVADDDRTGFRLWLSAGSPQTTAPISEAGVSSSLARTGDRVVFIRSERIICEPWSADATGKIQRLMEPFDCELDHSLTTAHDRVYFFGSAKNDHTIWRTDGTPEGTDRLAALGQGLGLGYTLAVSASGQKVFLPSGDGLWVWTESEGLRQVNGAGGPLTADSLPADLVSFGGRVLFSACDGTAREMWTTDGTAQATAPFTSLGIRCEYVFLGLDSAVAGSKLFVTEAGLDAIDTAGNDVSLWLGWSEIRGEVAFRDKLYFYGRTGFEWALWESDGTPEGTRRVWILPEDYAPYFETPVLTDGASLLLPMAKELVYNEIWRSDGTPEGTVRLVAGENLLPFDRVDVARLGTLTFLGLDDSLWVTDGTPDGTHEAFRDSGEPFEDPQGLVVLGDSVYLFDTSGIGSRWNLWRSDGTSEAVLLKTLVQPADYSSSRKREAPAVLNGKLYFAADDGVHGEELWVSDGTSQGTVLLADITPGRRGSSPERLVVAGNTLYFTAHDAMHGRELWRSDGTTAGTRLVQDIAPENLSSNPERLTVFEDRLYFTADDDAAGREVWSLSLTGPSPCAPSATVLCLREGRFQVEAQWRDFQGHLGAGQATSLTGDTGTFWFFDPSNVEVVVKVLDGRGLNDHHWVFYGALSSVSYSLTITDTQTGLARRYVNPPGRLASVGDTQGFGPLGAFPIAPKTFVTPPSPPALVSGRTAPAEATGSCTPGLRRLCLNGGRFAVEASWKDFQGHTGAGTAVSLTGDTGWFWFFDPSNVEVMLKVLDGTPLNGKFWVFYGALSNVEYTLTVTDTLTGAVKEYKNPSGRFASVADTEAF